MAPDDYLKIANSLGADRSLQKPFDIQHLVDMVAELLRG